MGLASRVGGIVEASLGVPRAVIANIFMLVCILFIGLVLVFARWALLEFCPYGARHSRAFTSVVNGFLDVVFAIFSMIKAAVGIIVDAVRILEGVSPTPIDIHGKPAHVTNAEMEEFFRTTPARCNDYSGLSTVLLLPTRHWMSPAVCPLIRYTWPVPWLYDITHGVLGWLSFDPTPISGAPPRNCALPAGDVDFLCVGLGAGYVIVEVIFPLLILLLVAGPLVEALVLTALSAATTVVALASKVGTAAVGLLLDATASAVTAAARLGKSKTP